MVMLTHWSILSIIEVTIGNEKEKKCASVFVSF